MKLIENITNNKLHFLKIQSKSIIPGLCILLLLLGNTQLQAAQFAVAPPVLNDTQKLMWNVINNTCGDSGNTQDYNTQCTNLLESSESQQTEQIKIISPEQTGSTGTNANKTSSSQTSSSNQSVLNRMAFLRSEPVATKVGNVQIYDNGNVIKPSSIEGLSLINKAAASADEYSKLGLWVNGIFRFGNVDSTFQESRGYDYNNLGVTIGLDYAITQDFIVGTAFTYLSTSGDYARDGGDFNTDLYNGAIYASYYITDDFYIDGLAFYGGNNYNITRNVSYVSSAGNVNERLKGTPGGRQYGFNLSTGYNFRFKRLIMEPYLSVGYIGSDIDSYSEKSLSASNAWATQYDDQNLLSVKTTLGALFAYNFDVPWGVIIPQIRGEWHHEFEDDRRNITSGFTGAADKTQNYSVIIENPDRDYFTFGASVTSTFDYGITAFFAYDMLIAYDNVNSYGFTLGGRIDF